MADDETNPSGTPETNPDWPFKPGELPPVGPPPTGPATPANGVDARIGIENRLRTSMGPDDSPGAKQAFLDRFNNLARNKGED